MRRLSLIALVTLISAAFARAQYRVGPVYPEKPSPVATPNQAQSGYDPFQLNSWTGRFEYVPIPYDNEPAGTGYSPFRFNWHSGQWDYLPVKPIEPAYGRIEHEPVASVNVDTRLNPGQQTATGEQPARSIIVPEPAAAPSPRGKPSTQPTTSPTGPAQEAAQREPFPTTPPPKMTRKLAGHWQYDYNRGKWVFVLPGD